jgi:hypothetical protein
MACGLRETVVIGWVHGGWQKYYSYTDRGNCDGVCGKVLPVEGHFITPYLSSLVVDEVTEGIDNRCCYAMGMRYLHQQKIPKHNLTATSAGCEYGTAVVWLKQISIHQEKFQNLDQYLNEICKQDIELCLQCGTAKCMNMRAVK